METSYVDCDTKMLRCVHRHGNTIGSGRQSMQRRRRDGKGGSARRGLDKGGLVFEEHRSSLFKDADVQSVAMANELLLTIHAIVETGDYWD